MYMSIKCADSACFNIAKVYAAVGTALVGEGGASSWTLVETEMDEDVQFIQATASTAAAAAAETAVVKTTQQSPVQLDSDSEEDDVIVVGSTSASASSVSTMMPRKQINLSKAVRKRKCK